MPIDPSIPLAAHPTVQVQSPVELLGQVLAIKRAQQQQQVGALELQEKKRQMAAEDALDAAIANSLKRQPDGTYTTDTDLIRSHLAQGPGAHLLPGLEKSWAERDKSQAEAVQLRQKLAEAEANDIGSLAARGLSVLDHGGTPDDAAGAILPDIAAHTKNQVIDRSSAVSIVSQLDEARKDPTALRNLFVDWQRKSGEQRKLGSEEVTSGARKTEADIATEKFAAEQPGMAAESAIKKQVLEHMKDGMTAEQAEQLARQTAANAEQARHNKAEEALAAKRLSLSNGSAEDGETVAYWVRQIKNDPTQWNMLANNKPLQQAVQNGLAKGGTDVSKLTAQSRMMAETAKEILPHIGTVQAEAEQLDKLGLMGPVGGRWRDFVAGKIGSGELAGGNPQNAKLLGEFQTNVGLLMSAVARAHGGARAGGSIAMITHLKSLLDAAGKDLPTFQGNLAATKDWMTGYAGMVPTDVPGTKPPPASGVKVLSIVPVK